MPQPSRSATKCYVALVEEISQRELRNDNAEVIRRVLEGESFVVTRRGVPVARLVPLHDEKDLRRDRAARLCDGGRQLFGRSPFRREAGHISHPDICRIGLSRFVRPGKSVF